MDAPEPWRSETGTREQPTGYVIKMDTRVGDWNLIPQRNSATQNLSVPRRREESAGVFIHLVPRLTG